MAGGEHREHQSSLPSPCYSLKPETGEYNHKGGKDMVDNSKVMNELLGISKDGWQEKRILLIN